LQVLTQISCQINKESLLNFVLQLLFNVNSGKGEVMTEYEPTTKNELCNGQWHTVKGMTTSLSCTTLNTLNKSIC